MKCDKCGTTMDYCQGDWYTDRTTNESWWECPECGTCYAVESEETK